MGLPEGQAPVNELTDEDRSKGGSNTTPMKALANSIRGRKWCSLECPFSDVCPMLPLSMSKESEVMVGDRAKHPCKLKDAPLGVQRRIKNLFLGDEEGLLTEIRGALFVVGQNLGKDVKERLAYIDSLTKLHRVIYGDKSNLNPGDQPFKITVRQYQSENKSAQEVQIGRQDKAAELLANRKPHVIQDELDPESLYLSPVLDAIVSVKKDD
jgi:hypothetical protein